MKPNFEDYYKIIERCRGSVNEHCSDPIIKELINNDFNNLEQELDETISGSAENPDKYQSVSSDNEDYFQQDDEQFDRFEDTWTVKKMSKGSKVRPYDKKKFDESFDRILNKGNKKSLSKEENNEEVQHTNINSLLATNLSLMTT